MRKSDVEVLEPVCICKILETSVNLTIKQPNITPLNEQQTV